MKDNELVPAQQERPRRDYRSPRRTAAARATRAAVIEAAARLLLERGYGATTLAAVADAAEVSLATVKLVAPTKASLLLEVVYSRARGDASAVGMTERAEWLEMLGAPTAAELLSRWAALAGAAYERQAAILEVLRQAASAEPAVAAVLREGVESRRSSASWNGAARCGRGSMRGSRSTLRGRSARRRCSGSSRAAVGVEIGGSRGCWRRFAASCLGSRLWASRSFRRPVRCGAADSPVV